MVPLISLFNQMSMVEQKEASLGAAEFDPMTINLWSLAWVIFSQFKFDILTFVWMTFALLMLFWWHLLFFYFHLLEMPLGWKICVIAAFWNDFISNNVGYNDILIAF
jgi:hypothetical protein